tara:strand:- start:1426 stop:1659 length:234 start_codon:yes stop_codon:yes gene_type:complete
LLTDNGNRLYEWLHVLQLIVSFPSSSINFFLSCEKSDFIFLHLGQLSIKKKALAMRLKKMMSAISAINKHLILSVYF